MLNLFLAIVTCGLGMALYVSWNKELPALVRLPVTDKSEFKKKQKRYVQQIPVVGNYDAITEQNVFSFNRKEYIPEQIIEEIEEKSVQSVVKISGKIIELFGVIQIGGEHNGLILNPSVGNAKKYRWVVKGDRIGNLQVTDVLTDRLLLRDGKEKFEIKLRDKKKRKKNTRSSVKSNPKIVSTKERSVRKNTPVNVKSKNANNTGSTIIHTPFGDIIRKK